MREVSGRAGGSRAQRALRPLGALLVLAALGGSVGAIRAHEQPAPEATPRREMRLLMGTTAEVWVGGAADGTQAIAAAFAALERVDRTLSLWQASNLTELNRTGQAREAPAELLDCLRVALEVARASQGAFDPTLEPLLRARGAYGGPRSAPRGRARRALLARVGYTRVTLDVAARAVRLAPGTTLDLGGVAKGLAVDLALGALRAAGARRALVDLGSSSQGVWGDALTLSIADPQQADAPAWGHFTLRDAHVSSSSVAQRGEHILDPRTGSPARRALGATVVASNGAEADALSTAVFVLGPEAGLALLTQRGAAGFVLTRERGRPSLYATPGFVETFGLETPPWVRVRE